VTRNRFASSLAAAALAFTWAVSSVGPAHAADPVVETAAEAYADLMAVQTATRTGWVSGYVIHAHGSSEGGWTWTETFDAVHQTLLWQPGRGPSRLETPTAGFRSIPLSARTRAVLALAGRPAAVWFADVYAHNPGYYTGDIGHEFDTLAVADPVGPGASPVDVVESATVSTDPDGTRHWIVQSHHWSPLGSTASAGLLVTADPQGRLSASGTVGSVDGATVTYDPPSVPRPTAQQYVLSSVYDLAEAAYTLRTRVVGAATSIITAAKGYASRHHRALTTSDVRYEAPRVIAVLPASLAQVRWTAVTSGVKVYGWNQFSRSWVIYLVRVYGHTASVTRVR
jgi:hypothetical protein